jgi:hypothetical protein
MFSFTLLLAGIADDRGIIPAWVSAGWRMGIKPNPPAPASYRKSAVAVQARGLLSEACGIFLKSVRDQVI